MKFSIGILAALAIFASAYGVDDCTYACVDNYMPVCGYDGHHYKVFANSCMMIHEGCKDVSQYREVRMQACENATPKASKSCLRVCPLIYNPVCASKGGRFELFDNICNLEVRNCEDKNQWRLTKMASCESKITTTKSCLKPCPFIYAPVCATNGVRMEIFDNSCVFEIRNCEENNKWRVTKMSACDEKPASKKNCIQICPLNYDPVCGFNGTKYQTFGNMCGYESQNCLSNYSWKLVKMGECPENN